MTCRNDNHSFIVVLHIYSEWLFSRKILQDHCNSIETAAIPLYNANFYCRITYIIYSEQILPDQMQNHIMGTSPCENDLADPALMDW